MKHVAQFEPYFVFVILEKRSRGIKLCDYAYVAVNYCLVCNINIIRLSQIYDNNKERQNAFCTVYDSRIVVTGDSNRTTFKSVEV